MKYTIVTGAVGFIASVLIQKLNSQGDYNIIAVDDFSNELKNRNLLKKDIFLKINRDDFENWFKNNYKSVKQVYHIGARTDTTEFDKSIFDKLNLNYSKMVWNLCTEFQIPLLYASSAATYGMGELGYDDNHQIIPNLKPLNPYGDSKNEFDKWVLKQEKTPPNWYGLKFFNVYGPNEYHKSRMASVIFHSYNQIKNTGNVKLFRSHNPNYSDGGQKRDFVYVKDVVEVLTFLMNNKSVSGIYNLGTGKARTFLDLAKAVFASQNLSENITFIDTPIDIRDKYQYFTEANMSKLISVAGYNKKFYSLEEGIKDYVCNYLAESKFI